MRFPVVSRWQEDRRLHQLQAAELEEKTRELEEARGEIARQRIGAERNRIARDLHDIVAHALSSIAVQAGAGAHLADDDPAKAKGALRVIEATSRQALAEMRRLQTVLQTDPETEGALAPQPGLDRLPELVARAEEAGLRVTLRVEGERGQIPESTDLAGYRIVQEALTNTLKHTDAARAIVAIRYRPQDVQVEVWDAGAPPRAADPGNGDDYGLRGMAERVALYGGEFEAGPQAGRGFRVRARLPLESAGAFE